MENKFEMIPLHKLSMNGYNIRRFEEGMTPQRLARFNELVESIRAVGILEPLVVRPFGDGFEIIAGERRYRAVVEIANGVEGHSVSLPCMVRDVNDADAFDLMVIENLQRDDLTPFETASAFRAYLDKHAGLPGAVNDLSLRTGIPPHAIRRMVRLLDLPAEVLQAWKDGQISQTHAELFTRVGDQGQVAELLAACLRSKLSARELAERIGSAACELERGFFDKTDCQVCPDNTSVQSGLFADLTPAGRCGSSSCFEKKQSEFLEANWQQSKPAQLFGTNGFRFGHRLGADYRSLSDHLDTADRCRACEAFVSILRVTGAVVSGYSRVCVGPRVCFEELYVNRPEEEPEEGSEETTSETPAPAVDPAANLKANLGKARPAAQPKPTTAAKAPEKKQAPEETGPVFDAARGERARKAFIKQRLMDNGSEVISYRLGLLALAVSSASARGFLSDLTGLSASVKLGRLAEAIFEIAPDDLYAAMRQAAATHIMADYTLAPEVWQFAADRFGIDVAADWSFNETYLSSLNKSEIVRIGEEPGVGIWVDSRAEEYRQEHFKGKALMALKKEELIDIIMKSGAAVPGRVPREIIGKKG